MKGNNIVLSEIASLQLGYQARGRIEEDLDGDFCIIRAQDIDDFGRLISDQTMRFRSSPEINIRKYLVQRQDILFLARSQNHRAYLIEEALENTVASNIFYIIRVKDKSFIDPEYLTWWLNQPEAQAYFVQVQGQGMVPFISISSIRKTEVSIPAMNLQKLICKVYSSWNKERDLAGQLNEKKAILIQTVALKAIAQSLEDK